MTINNLIKENLLQKIDNISLKQIERRFTMALSFSNSAKIDLKNKNKDNIVVYNDIYNSIRIMGETFLLLNGYKASVKNYHKTVIEAMKKLMDIKDMNFLFDRLDRMRKNRNKLDYDINSFDISKKTLENMLLDAGVLAKKIKSFINKSNPQEKLV